MRIPACSMRAQKSERRSCKHGHEHELVTRRPGRTEEIDHATQLRIVCFLIHRGNFRFEAQKARRSSSGMRCRVRTRSRGGPPVVPDIGRTHAAVSRPTPCTGGRSSNEAQNKDGRRTKETGEKKAPPILWLFSCCEVYYASAATRACTAAADNAETRGRPPPRVPHVCGGGIANAAMYATRCAVRADSSCTCGRLQPRGLAKHRGAAMRAPDWAPMSFS
ncbi:hypothetical protein MTO96_016002 [Rhipicephalus appendiculatus]